MTDHLALPIRRTAQGRCATVPAGSVAAIAQSVAMLLDTRPGERLSIPAYGMDDPTWRGVDPTVTIDAIGQWEPRADVTIEVDRTDETGRQTAGFVVARREAR